MGHPLRNNSCDRGARPGLVCERFRFLTSQSWRVRIGGSFLVWQVSPGPRVVESAGKFPEKKALIAPGLEGAVPGTRRRAPIGGCPKSWRGRAAGDVRRSVAEPPRGSKAPSNAEVRPTRAFAGRARALCGLADRFRHRAGGSLPAVNPGPRREKSNLDGEIAFFAPTPLAGTTFEPPGEGVDRDSRSS